MKKILVVEDDFYISKLYQRTFTLAGFTVDVAVSGKQALEKSQTETYDVILLDVMLGDMSGLDVLKLWRAPDHRFKSTPVFLSTNRGEDTVVKQGFALGMEGYFYKSQYVPQDLVNEINSFFSKQGETSPGTLQPDAGASAPSVVVSAAAASAVSVSPAPQAPVSVAPSPNGIGGSQSVVPVVEPVVPIAEPIIGTPIPTVIPREPSSSVSIPPGPDPSAPYPQPPAPSYSVPPQPNVPPFQSDPLAGVAAGIPPAQPWQVAPPGYPSPDPYAPAPYPSAPPPSGIPTAPQPPVPTGQPAVPSPVGPSPHIDGV